MKNLKDKKITVVGLARSGLAVAEFLNNAGAKVKVTDIKEESSLSGGDIERLREKGILIEVGTHSREFIDNADLVVTSPGIGPDASPLRWAEEAGIPVTGELELASQFVPCPIIAVTGTNGKTTVVTLLGEILKRNHKVEVAGNIGVPLSGVIERLTDEHLLVLEVSSFQLETIINFHPVISVVLNVTPDHLNRYRGFEDYLSAKKRIFLNQGPDDYAVFPADAFYTEDFIEEIKARYILFGAKSKVKRGIYYSDSFIWSNINGREEKILDRSDIKLTGPHNLENVMAALAVTSILKEDFKTVGEVIKNFSGLEHRIEVVSVINGVTFINDSKSTNVDSLIRAIQSFDRIILIAGGRDKGADFTGVRKDIEKKVKQIVLFGEARNLLKDTWAGTRPIYLAENLEQAVLRARDFSRQGDVVLFSPGCSSFDMFKNFEERGKAFKEIVLKLSR